MKYTQNCINEITDVLYPDWFKKSSEHEPKYRRLLRFALLKGIQRK